MRPPVRRFGFLILTASLFLSLAASSALAGSATTTRYVALTGSVGAGTSCASPGYIGVDGAQAALDNAGAGDTIHLCAGTWILTDGSSPYGFQVGTPIVMEGDGQDQTIIDGTARNSPAITVGNSLDSLTVRDLTIQNGLSESGVGGISAAGQLTVEDATLRGNGGTTISSDNTFPLVIRRSTLIGKPLDDMNGPLVFSGGPTTIEESTLADNVSPLPVAGVFVQGPEGTDVTVDSSTFSGLVSSTGGDDPYGCTSSLWNYSDGADAGITITNSTFTDNIAATFECASAHIASGGFLTMKNSTFAGNTGVRDNGGLPWGDLVSFYGMTLANNIIVGDPDSPATCQTYQGDITNDGGNVISDETVGCDGFVGGPSPSPQAKVLESAIDLGPLADNGGPTETMALGAASVARGAAILAECPATDQRGVTRSGPCSSGAWQQGPSGKPKVDQRGRGGSKSLKVRVRCGGTSPCQIRLTGRLKGGKGTLKSRKVTVPSGGKSVTLLYSNTLKRSLTSRGGKGMIRVTAKEIGGGSASTLVRVRLPDSVTG